jgi:hypothetical protein
MPTNPRWLLRLPEIISKLRDLTAPWIDRSTVESIFRLRRRHAIELMHRFGSYRTARRFVLDRTILIKALEELQGEPQVRWGQYLAGRGAGIDHQNVGLEHEYGSQPAGSPLPDGIRFLVGQVVINFTSREELRARLSALIWWLTNVDN